MAGQVPTTGGRLSVCVLVLTAWNLLVPVAGAGCPTVRLFGSTRLSPYLRSGTYSMDGPVRPGIRPKYRNDESKTPVFFEDGYWHVENLNRIRVRDSSFYLEDITETFEIWVSGQGEFVVDPEAHFSCADITYICKGDKKTIRCPRTDFQKLLIVRATYGQDWACKLSGCTDLERNADCTSCFWVSRNDVITRVKDRCTRARGNCTLEPSDEMLGGNPCDHISGEVDTYLKVEHRCINIPMSLGCYQDEPVDNPLLPGPSFSHPNMTIQKCITYCRPQSYRYAGVANRFGCRCGNQTQQGFSSRGLSITDCIAPCGGDEFQFCGGPSSSQKMEVFETSVGACGGDLRTNEGIIYSPNFPGPYPEDQNCIWNVQVSSENAIRISVELLDISTEDSLAIIEDRSSQTVITVLNGTSMTEYVSVSSNVSLQFRAGRQRAQQTDGVILRYKGVGHCGPVAVVGDVISVSPNHGGNVALGQHATITCKNGQNITVQCQEDGSFDIPTPYCNVADKAMWMAIVGGIVAVLVLLAIVLVVAIFIIRKRRAAQKQHGTTSPGTATYSAAPTSDSLVLTPGNLSARAPGGENESEDDLHQYASIRDTGPFGTEPLYAQPDSGTKKPIELMYAKPMKKKKGSPSGNEEEGIVDNILYERSVGEERHGQAMNGEQQGLIDNNLYELQ
ncbi:KREMEN1 [Branchiostoma lanceolatum]|uniref:KREMEN1 protein n=1 Tax=Branchiostoma lanceolatum TaxID=7740 RepID=A0A8K0EFA4_BRALA|nr:KREMEN1 [Branchiostoma lanceolatum]